MAFTNLGRTQRDIIRGHNELDLIDPIEGIPVDNDDLHIEMKAEKTEEKRFCLPKCFLLGFCLLILLAGLISLIYFYKDDKSGLDLRGEVQTTEVPLEECPDVYVILGEPFVIKCEMNGAITGDVKAIYANVVGSTTDDFQCIKDDKNKKAVNCTANHEARCSSFGNVILQFFDGIDDNKKINFTKTVRVKAPDIFPTATIKQVFQNETSEFQLTCSHKGDCTGYGVRFYGSNQNLADSVSCATTYSDSEGYNVDCSAVVSSEVINDVGNGSKLYCQLMDGSVKKKETELELPACNDFAVNSEDCKASTTVLFDCGNLANVTSNCDKTCEVAEQCFSARVHEIVSTTDSDLCPRCVLEWCRETQTLEINNSGKISFSHLCGNSSMSLK